MSRRFLTFVRLYESSASAVATGSMSRTVALIVFISLRHMFSDPEKYSKNYNAHDALFCSFRRIAREHEKVCHFSEMNYDNTGTKANRIVELYKAQASHRTEVRSRAVISSVGCISQYLGVLGLGASIHHIV